MSDIVITLDNTKQLDASRLEDSTVIHQQPQKSVLEY